MSGRALKGVSVALALVVLVLGGLLLWGVLGERGTHNGASGVTTADAPREQNRTPFEAETGMFRGAQDAVTLLGRVVDETLRPVEGATVHLSGDAHGEHLSGAGGTFQFENLRPGAYFLEAFRGQAAAAPVRVQCEAGSRYVELRLQPGASLDVFVRSKRSGSPVAGATVEILPPPERGDVPVRTGTTDATGHVRFLGFAPGSYALRAVAADHQPEETYLTPQAGLAWRAVIELRSGAPVMGRVLTSRGSPVAGAVVTPLPLEIADAFLTRPRSSRHATTTDSRGEFVYPALDEGAFFLFVTHNDFLPGKSAPFQTDGRTPVRGLEIRLDEGAVVAGRVVQADGRPQPRAVVRANALDVAAPGGGVRMTVTDEKGAFILKGLPRERVDFVASWLDATSEDVVLDLLATPIVEGVVLSLVHTLAIAGTVVERDGTPIPNAQVVCVGTSRGAIGTRPIVPETTDAEGRFACRGLPPGEYALTAMRPYPNNNQSPWARSAGTLTVAGDTNVVIRLPQDGGLRGRVLLPGGVRAPRSFGVQIDPGGEPRPFSSADGSFELLGIAPRQYELRVVAEGGLAATRQVLVPEGDIVDLGTIQLEQR